ncbi:MAG: peptidoglycan DD-metalloendopeptidase family protein, partial [Bacilli bacterium]|nr:peptidoglycan DD-metalloendopeptidase family protein [Bacilli bacterium]
ISGTAGGAYCAVNGEINQEAWKDKISTAGVFSGKGNLFIKIAGEQGIDPVLMAAIALHETASGTSKAVVTKNNPGGLMGSDGLMQFSTLEEGLASMGKTLHNRIITDGKVSINKLGSVYAPLGAENDPTNLNAHWVPTITAIVSALGGLTMNCTVESGEFAQPIPNVQVNSNYGVRIHPITGEINNHQGVDFACSNPDPIYAAKDGKVVYAAFPSSYPTNTYGNIVVIQHTNNLFTAYAHLSRISVEVGQEIGQLDVIGQCGSTGRSTGDHLHFEIQTGEMFGTRINPMSYFTPEEPE